MGDCLFEWFHALNTVEQADCTNENLLEKQDITMVMRSIWICSGLWFISSYPVTKAGYRSPRDDDGGVGDISGEAWWLAHGLSCGNRENEAINKIWISTNQHRVELTETVLTLPDSLVRQVSDQSCRITDAGWERAGRVMSGVIWNTNESKTSKQMTSMYSAVASSLHPMRREREVEREMERGVWRGVARPVVKSEV